MCVCVHIHVSRSMAYAYSVLRKKLNNIILCIQFENFVTDLLNNKSQSHLIRTLSAIECYTMKFYEIFDYRFDCVLFILLLLLLLTISNKYYAGVRTLCNLVSGRTLANNSWN